MENKKLLTFDVIFNISKFCDYNTANSISLTCKHLHRRICKYLFAARKIEIFEPIDLGLFKSFVNRHTWGNLYKKYSADAYAVAYRIKDYRPPMKDLFISKLANTIYKYAIIHMCHKPSLWRNLLDLMNELSDLGITFVRKSMHARLIKPPKFYFDKAFVKRMIVNSINKNADLFMVLDNMINPRLNHQGKVLSFRALNGTDIYYTHNILAEIANRSVMHNSKIYAWFITSASINVIKHNIDEMMKRAIIFDKYDIFVNMQIYKKTLASKYHVKLLIRMGKTNYLKYCIDTDHESLSDNLRSEYIGYSIEMQKKECVHIFYTCEQQSYMVFDYYAKTGKARDVSYIDRALSFTVEPDLYKHFINVDTEAFNYLCGEQNLIKWRGKRSNDIYAVICCCRTMEKFHTILNSDVIGPKIDRKSLFKYLVKNGKIDGINLEYIMYLYEPEFAKIIKTYLDKYEFSLINNHEFRFVLWAKDVI